ncbi:MAG: 1-deoxy-D-xylulose-5-phosphate reductoisomerase [Oscillospiraceae bacterium]|nr:1-deoxy-D-xylulose-5-phosphate reductoisomerase [Oscillospiraceae bacterium]
MDLQGRKLAILGSTGSIGTQTLAVCRDLGLCPVALTGGSNIERLESQAREFRPALVAVADPRAAAQLKIALADTDVRVLAQDGMIEAATLPSADVIVGAVVGIAGLAPVLEAAKAGKTIALANKEPLVAAGRLVMQTAREHGGKILPVDSEHSAIFQCLHAGERDDVTGIFLTASGGPFFGRSREELLNVTPQEAVKHPNWAMGAKISVDSATLMNKGLELIEAVHLFDLTPGQIEIAVHRQSILHSAVYFSDGSLIGQMSKPDMRSAIQYALTYPRRWPVAGLERLSLTEIGSLTFEKPDKDTFTCLAACEEAANRGGLYPAAVNAANEAAVARFLKGEMTFLQIGDALGELLGRMGITGEADMESVCAIDAQARAFIKEI